MTVFVTYWLVGGDIATGQQLETLEISKRLVSFSNFHGFSKEKRWENNICDLKIKIRDEDIRDLHQRETE